MSALIRQTKRGQADAARGRDRDSRNSDTRIDCFVTTPKSLNQNAICCVQFHGLSAKNTRYCAKGGLLGQALRHGASNAYGELGRIQVRDNRIGLLPVMMMAETVRPFRAVKRATGRRTLATGLQLPRRSWLISRASTSRSTSSFVLYRPNEARQVAVKPSRSING